MGNYFIGDIQGCFTEFEKLIYTTGINYNKDTLWICGDLVARGDESLAVLKYCYQNQDFIKIVLGNHDINLLAVSEGIRAENKKDKISAILNCDDLPKYIDWLRTIPLVQTDEQLKVVMTHAGFPPMWDLPTLLTSCYNAHQALQSDQYKEFLKYIYQIKINNWSQANTIEEQNTFTVNAITRMRYIYNKQELDLTCKEAPSEQTASKQLQPWFNLLPEPLPYTIIFGHWASLMGNINKKSIIGLDTGCVWGNKLTAWHYETNTYFTQSKIK